MMVHQQNERFPLLGRKLETFGHALREKSACFGMGARADRPVAEQRVARSWLWGDAPFAGGYEAYANAPGGQRLVQYFDKARMEINQPAADPSGPFYVTNGLLVVEMLSGRLQTGDTSFTPYAPAVGQRLTLEGRRSRDRGSRGRPV